MHCGADRRTNPGKMDSDWPTDAVSVGNLRARRSGCSHVDQQLVLALSRIERELELRRSVRERE